MCAAEPGPVWDYIMAKTGEGVECWLDEVQCWHSISSSHCTSTSTGETHTQINFYFNSPFCAQFGLSKFSCACVVRNYLDIWFQKTASKAFLVKHWNCKKLKLAEHLTDVTRVLQVRRKDFFVNLRSRELFLASRSLFGNRVQPRTILLSILSQEKCFTLPRRIKTCLWFGRKFSKVTQIYCFFCYHYLPWYVSGFWF